MINFKNIDEIIPKNRGMIFCTCAEKDQKRYFKRIKAWNEQLNSLNLYDFDRFCFNDGKIIEKLDSMDNISFIEFDDALGRITSMNFPGWKRSLAYAMKLSIKYDYSIHLESDTVIANKKLIEHFKKQGTFVTFCNQHNFIDSSFMILNDKNMNHKIYEWYSINTNLFVEECAETTLKRLMNPTIIGKNMRIENMLPDFINYDIVGQCGPSTMMEFIKSNQ